MGGRVITTLLLFLSLLATTPISGQEEPFHGEVEVRRIITEVRVVHHDGSPVIGLGPEDFQVTVDGRSAAVESVDWIAESRPLEASLEVDDPHWQPDVEADQEDSRPRGRLIVLLYQTDMDPSRTSGLMRVDGHVIGFVQHLSPEDRVAVAVMSSHLQLHSDFTDDFDSLAEQLSIIDVLQWRHAEDDGREPSIARHFDWDRAKRAISISEALEIVGDSLAPLPGTKAVVLVGWGAGSFNAKAGTVRLGKPYVRALRALQDAHASVFALDITSADRHSLEVGLEWLAEDTGGFYIKTHLFPEVAIAKLTRTLTGHYLLTLIPPEETPDEVSKIRVSVDRPNTDVMKRRLHFNE
jgi:VWFA-related protein